LSSSGTPACAGNAQAIGGKSDTEPFGCVAVLSNVGHGKFMGLGARIVIGACILAASVAMFPALPQSGELVPFRAGDLEAAAFIDVSLQAARQDAATESDRQAAPLFGMETEPVAGEVAARWRVIETDIDREQQVLARCRAQEACPVVAQNLLDIVAEGAGRSGIARVGLINRAVDLAITPTSDQAQWGVTDHWSPPFETLRTHRGDCEDYAILKYVALLQAGLSRDDVKIVILHNLLPKEDHAVTAARVDGQWLILDNRRLALVHDTEMVGSIPKFVLDEDGTRPFVPPNRAGQQPISPRGIGITGRQRRLINEQRRLQRRMGSEKAPISAQ
jgi:predicted transglutaminase-like cysteine proteinase